MKLLVICLSLMSILWALPVDIEENETYELEKTSVAVITKIDGKAKILSKESIKKHKAKLGEALFEGDILITYAASTVLVELDDSSKVILNESSELSFTNKIHLEQRGGEVYYKIKTRKASKGLEVKTPFSIMGIKGTEFIVGAQGQIALNEGLVAIRSLEMNFELHKQKVMQAYKEFKDEQNRAFEDYKSAGENQTISYVREFDLEAGKVLEFFHKEACQESCEAKVNEKVISQEMLKRFERYKQLLSE